jgi:hypothetical protein
MTEQTKHRIVLGIDNGNVNMYENVQGRVLDENGNDITIFRVKKMSYYDVTETLRNISRSYGIGYMGTDYGESITDYNIAVMIINYHLAYVISYQCKRAIAYEPNRSLKSRRLVHNTDFFI